MLLLNEREVSSLLPMDDVLQALREVFAAQAQGAIHMPMRTLAPAGDGVLGAMPASVSAGTPALGAKLVTFFPGNAGSGHPTHNALIALFDSESGLPLAVMDGRFITEVRTAATSALATEMLARPNARTLAILGTGVQARAHVDALAGAMDIGELRIWGRTSARTAELSDFARQRGHHTRIAQTVEQACRGADVICTLTSSREPILKGSDVHPGAHINAVGFAGPSARELASDVMTRSTIVVDSLDGAQHESGNIILAIKDGALPAEPKLTLLCDVLAGRAAGRRSADEITLFDSLGIAIEDLACACRVYERARESHIGTAIDLS